MTGSSLAEFLGLFEPLAGRALTKAGVYAKMRDHSKLTSKVLSLQTPKQNLVQVDPQTQIFFDWGHKHEANGILSYLNAHAQSVVHEVGFVLLDPSLKTLPEEIRQGIDPANLPVIGSSPDGIIVETPSPPGRKPFPQGLQGINQAPNLPAHLPHQHWRKSHPSHRRVLEIKAKTPFRPDNIPGVWRWLGISCKPYAKILPQYFAQAQLNMLVTGCQSCHLLCYTVKGGSAVFSILLHKQWCNQMLYWVSQLNTRYVVKGLAPPENVFWDHEGYRAFVEMTSDACQSLNNSAVEVPSLQGSMNSPWFLPAPDATVPNTPEVDSAEQLTQHQQHQQQQQQQLQQQQLQQQQQQQQQQQEQQTLPACPPKWQQQLQGQLLPPAPPGWQQQQQQQCERLPAQQPSVWQQNAPTFPRSPPPLPQHHHHQQQQSSVVNNGLAASVPAAQAPSGIADSTSAARLRLLAAAAIPLPDGDVTMEDADQLAPPSGLPEQDPGYLRRPHARVSGPVGVQGLATCMQHILHQHCLDLRSLLSSSCQEALSLLAPNDVRVALERLAQEVKKTANTLCMHHIRGLTPPAHQRPEQEAAFSSPVNAASNARTALDDRRAASRSPGAAAFSPVQEANCESCHTDIKAACVADFGSIPTRRQSLIPSATGPAATKLPMAPRPAASSRATKPAAIKPFARAAAAAGAAPLAKRASPGPSLARISSVDAVQAGAVAGKCHATATAAEQSGACAQGFVHPDCYTLHVNTGAEQPEAVFNSPEVGPSKSNPRAGPTSSSPNLGAGPGLIPVKDSMAFAPDIFGGQLLPANMTSNVKWRLHSVVARHALYLRPEHFDSAILTRLASMPEHKAMSVLHQADTANWPSVHNNTKMIMSWCCKWTA